MTKGEGFRFLRGKRYCGYWLIFRDQNKMPICCFSYKRVSRSNIQFQHTSHRVQWLSCVTVILTWLVKPSILLIWAPTDYCRFPTWKDTSLGTSIATMMVSYLLLRTTFACVYYWHWDPLKLQWCLAPLGMMSRTSGTMSRTSGTMPRTSGRMSRTLGMMSRTPPLEWWAPLVGKPCTKILERIKRALMLTRWCWDKTQLPDNVKTIEQFLFHRLMQQQIGKIYHRNTWRKTWLLQ